MSYRVVAASALVCLLLTSCSQSPEKLLATANKYHQKQKYKEASILYQKVISKDKTNAEAYYREGLNLLDQRQPGEASKFLRRAVDLKPDNTDAELKLAEIYLTFYSADPKRFKKLLDDSQDLVNKAAQREPDAFPVLRLEALVDLAQRKMDDALTVLAKANGIKPYDRDLVGWYAEALMGANRPDDAEKLIRDMLAHDKTWGPGYDLLYIRYMRENKLDQAEAVIKERVDKDPTNVTAISNLSTELLRTGHYAEAEAVMQRVLNDKKSFPNGRMIMGDFYIRAKKFDQALQQYQTGKSESPKEATAYDRRIVAAYALMGKHDDATALAKKLAENSPKDAMLGELYGSLLIGPGSNEPAPKVVEELNKLVHDNPNDAPLHLDAARALFAANQPDKSLSEALSAADLEAKAQHSKSPVATSARLLAGRIYETQSQHAKALEQMELVLAGDPNNAEARVIRDSALIRLNEADRAQPDLEALVKQYPQLNDGHLELAQLYLSQHLYDKASEQYTLVWKGNPPDNRGLVGLQEVKVAQGKGDDAIATMQDLVQKYPGVVGYRFQLANFQTMVGEEELRTDPAKAKPILMQAEQNFREILKTASSAELWLRLGEIQKTVGQNDEALASFEQASVADPHNTAALLESGILLEALGKKKEAVDAYTKVLGIDGDNTAALNNLAFLSAESGTNLDQAMTFAERAKKKVPDNPEVSDTLGFVYYKKNLNDEALRIFRQLVQDRPQNPTFHFHLAMALLKQGDKQGARQEAERALKTAGPDMQPEIKSFVSQIG